MLLLPAVEAAVVSAWLPVLPLPYESVLWTAVVSVSWKVRGILCAGSPLSRPGPGLDVVTHSGSWAGTLYIHEGGRSMEALHPFGHLQAAQKTLGGDLRTLDLGVGQTCFEHQ